MLIVPAAPAVEIETSDPVAEAIPHIEARTGVVITTEWAPSMKLEKHPFTFDLPAPNAAAARGAVESLIARARSWPHWDGCTRYSVIETPYGLHVAPTHSVDGGACVPFESALDRRVGIGGGAYRGDRQMYDLTRTVGVAVMRLSGRLDVPPEGLTVREILNLKRPEGQTWSAHQDAGSAIWFVKVEAIGAVLPDDSPMADYPFHTERVQARATSTSSEEESIAKQQRDAATEASLAASQVFADEVVAEFQRLIATGLSEEEANIALREWARDRSGDGEE